MSLDPDEQREASLQAWEAAAPGWARHQRLVRAWAAPVSQWLVEALDPQPGQRVLELAAGLGETGMLAAELVAPVGTVTISDQAEAMLDGARERATALGLSNVEFRVLNAEWIDEPVASFDAVLCRWGVMLMTDPGAALGEVRRVLRPGGRLALAVWDELEANPWAALAAQELRDRGIGGPAGGPGPFALADRGRLRELLQEAGFDVLAIEAVALTRRHASFAEFWDTQLDMSPSYHDAVLSLPAEQIEQLRASLERRLAPYTGAGGTVELPGSSLVALAEA
jgi:SAM-dependent methyltransferase